MKTKCSRLRGKQAILAIVRSIEAEINRVKEVHPFEVWENANKIIKCNGKMIKQIFSGNEEQYWKAEFS